jgi:hypothetical protein
MPDSHVNTPTVSLTKKLEGHARCGSSSGTTAPGLTRHASWRNRWWKLWPDSGSSVRWSQPAQGGEEWPWPIWMRVVEELSTVDGAVGWNAGVGSAANAIVSGWVSEDVARTVFCQDPVGVVAGAGAPMGTARPVEGGVPRLRPVAIRQRESSRLLVHGGVCG